MKLEFQSNIGARPFLFGMARAEVRAIVNGAPYVHPREPQCDKYAKVGLFFGYDQSQLLVFAEIAPPSQAIYAGIDLLKNTPSAMDELRMIGAKSIDLFGTYVYRDIGVAITKTADGIQSAAVFKAGFYDELIAEFADSM